MTKDAVVFRPRASYHIPTHTHTHTHTHCDANCSYYVREHCRTAQLYWEHTSCKADVPLTYIHPFSNQQQHSLTDTEEQIRNVKFKSFRFPELSSKSNFWSSSCRAAILYWLRIRNYTSHHYLNFSVILHTSSSSSPPPPSSYICHGVRPLVDPFRSHVSRSLFKGLPRFLLPVGK